MATATGIIKSPSDFGGWRFDGGAVADLADAQTLTWDPAAPMDHGEFVIAGTPPNWQAINWDGTQWSLGIRRVGGAPIDYSSYAGVNASPGADSFAGIAAQLFPGMTPQTGDTIQLLNAAGTDLIFGIVDANGDWVTDPNPTPITIQAMTTTPGSPATVHPPVAQYMSMQELNDSGTIGTTQGTQMPYNPNTEYANLLYMPGDQIGHPTGKVTFGPMNGGGWRAWPIMTQMSSWTLGAPGTPTPADAGYEDLWTLRRLMIPSSGPFPPGDYLSIIKMPGDPDGGPYTGRVYLDGNGWQSGVAPWPTLIDPTHVAAGTPGPVMPHGAAVRGIAELRHHPVSRQRGVHELRVAAG